MNNEVVLCAGGVIIGPDGRIALTWKRGKPGASFPKGHVDPDDISLESAARREIAEETGLIQLELVADLGHYIRDSSNGERKQIHLFLYLTDQTHFAPTDGKHTAAWQDVRVAWFTLRQQRPVDADQLVRFEKQIQSAIATQLERQDLAASELAM